MLSRQAQVTTFYKNDEQVVAQRREGLQRYLNIAVRVLPSLCVSSPCAKRIHGNILRTFTRLDICANMYAPVQAKP